MAKGQFAQVQDIVIGKWSVLHLIHVASKQEGFISEAKLPVQELDSQREEEAYFRRGVVFGRIWYCFIVKISITVVQ